MSRFLCALCNEEHDEDSNPHFSPPESVVSKERFYFDSDEDGHDYLVPLELRKEFQKTLEECFGHTWGDDEYYAAQNRFEEKFGKYRIGKAISRYSFTNPEEIE